MKKFLHSYSAHILLLHFFLLCGSVFPDDSAIPAPTQRPKAQAVLLASCHLKPQSASLPVTYLKKGDTCSVQEVTVDSAGNPWFAILVKSQTLWSPAKYWTYVSDIDPDVFIEGKQSDEDKKRRLLILREHQDWPRRIIRAVRLGQICLDMTGEQLVACWEQPIQKSTAFTVGIGNHDLWLFSSSKSQIVVVLLKDNKIIGWSTK